MVTARVAKLKEINTRKLLEKHRIRPCYVKLFRFNVQGSRQTLKEHGIRECSVVLVRLKDDFLAKNPSRLLSKSKNLTSVRSNVAWLPTKSSSERNSAKAVAVLTAHRNSGQNSASKRIGEIFSTTVPVKRQRAISFCDDRSTNKRQSKPPSNDLNSFQTKASKKTVRFCVVTIQNETVKSKSASVLMKRQRSMSIDSSANISQSKPTMDEFFEEMLEKRKHLRPVNERVLQHSLDLGQVPLWKQIQSEFQKKMDEK